MKFERFFGGVVLIGAVLAMGLFVCEQYWYLGFVPPQIRTAGAVRISGKSGFLSGCGVAIFHLSTATRDAIRRQGLAFLGPARAARQTTYEFWHETPMRAEMLGGMNCASLSRSLSDDVYKGAEKPGSYYAMEGQTILLVIPESKLVVFSYLD